MATIKTEMPPLHTADGGGAGNSVSSADGGGSTNATAVVSSGPHSNSSGGGGVGIGETGATVTTHSGNNTISAAADSSDNQPGTPQPTTNNTQQQLITSNEQQQQQQQQLAQMPYGGMYSAASAATANAGGGALPHMYAGGGGIYAANGAQSDMQTQQQQQYPSYLNSYEQFYHQQQQQQQQQQIGPTVDYSQNASGLVYGASSGGGGATNTNEYKTNSSARYQPYPQAHARHSNPTTAGGAATNDSNTNEINRNSTPDGASSVSGGGGSTLSLSQSNAAVSTTTNSLSPRVVSSSSPTSTSAHLQLGGGSAAGSPGGGCKLQCKKCGLMCNNENELQEHITNVHGASPYGSSGYSSSPYIKEELSTGSQQHGQQGGGSGANGGGGNPGELLDLDSQKMIYPPAPGSIQSLLSHPQQMHDAVGANDPLHSMHSMQQRALPGWETATQLPNGGMTDAMPNYMQQQQSQPQTTDQQQAGDLNGKPIQANPSPYYGTTVGNTPVSIKQEYGLIKSEYPDSQNYIDKSFDPTIAGGEICQQTAAGMQQQTTMMPVSSSPAEFPSTTTGPQDSQQQYRGFEPPTSSSVTTGSLPTKAATWKSNEARRPKTYNCTACNKWFTSSGHLKRHYNTTLHKNAVKSSGQPDPATLPISAHHHPTRDPIAGTKSHSRRSNASTAAAVAAAAAATAAAAQQQQANAAAAQASKETIRSPQDFVQATGMGQMSQYSDSPSPTHQAQMNGLAYGSSPSAYQAQQQQRPYMNQIQSSSSSVNNHSPQHVSGHMNVATNSSNNTQTVLNGHPNGLAGPSAQATQLTTMPSSRTRGLLKTTTNTNIITITKIEPMEDNFQPNSSLDQLELESNSEQDIMSSPMQLERSQMDMEVLEQQQPRQLEVEEEQEEESAAAAVVAAQQVLQGQVHLERHQLVLPRMEQVEGEEELEEVERLESYQHHLMASLEEAQQHRYHSNTPPTQHNPAALAHITSRQQYREPALRRLPPMAVDSIFSPMHQQAVAPMQANIMDQAYNLIPLGINTPQLLNNNMQLLQPPPHITTSTATTLNMDNIHMLQQPLHNPHHHNIHHSPHIQEVTADQQQQQQQQLPLPSMRNTPLLNNTNIQQSQLDTTNTVTTTTLQPLQPITTTTTTIQPQQQPLQQQQQQLHTINTIQSYQQQQQQASELVQLEPTMTYHTIIGNSTNNGGDPAFNTNHGISISSHSTDSNDSSEVLQLTTLDPYGHYQTQQMVTADGHILQFMPSALMSQPFLALPSTSLAPLPPLIPPPSSFRTTNLRESYPRSPQEGDLPPVHTIMSHANSEFHTFEASQSLSGGGGGEYVDAMDLYPTSTTKEEQDLNPNASMVDTTIDAQVRCQSTAAVASTSNDVVKKSNKTVVKSISPATTTTKRNIHATTTTTSKKRNVSVNMNKSKGITKPRGPTENRTVTRYQRPPIICTTDPIIQELPGGRLKCMECDKEFSKACYVTQHKASFHRGEYPYRCSKCGKRYQDESKYNVHFERHFSANKPHKCVLCPKQFHYKTDLRRHIEAKHNEVLPHGCSVCPKGFCRQDHLRKHIDTHAMIHRKGRKVSRTYENLKDDDLLQLDTIKTEQLHQSELVDRYNEGMDEDMEGVDLDEGLSGHKNVGGGGSRNMTTGTKPKSTQRGRRRPTKPSLPPAPQPLLPPSLPSPLSRPTKLEPTLNELQNLTLTNVSIPLSNSIISMDSMILDDSYMHNDADDEMDQVEGYVIIDKKDKQLSAYF